MSSGIIVELQAGQKIKKNSLFVAFAVPCDSWRWRSSCFEYDFESGENTTTSSGCKLWVTWGGNIAKRMLLPSQKPVKSADT
jgi:hypothetical protein